MAEWPAQTRTQKPRRLKKMTNALGVMWESCRKQVDIGKDAGHVRTDGKGVLDCRTGTCCFPHSFGTKLIQVIRVCGQANQPQGSLWITERWYQQILASLQGALSS